MLNTGPLNDSVYENGKWHVFLAISRALWIWICPVSLVDPGVVNCMHFQWTAWGFRIPKWKQTVRSGQDIFKKMRYLWGQCAVCTGFCSPTLLVLMIHAWHLRWKKPAEPSSASYWGCHSQGLNVDGVPPAGVYQGCFGRVSIAVPGSAGVSHFDWWGEKSTVILEQSKAECAASS